MTIETNVVKQEALPREDVGVENNLSPKKETLSALGMFLQKRMQKLKDLRERSDWEKEKAFAFNYYHMYPRTRALPFPGAANLTCPLPRIGVDSFHANVMASLFANDNRMKIDPLIIQKEFASTAGKAAQYLTYVMNHEADAYMTIDDWDRKAHIFGCAFIEPSYKKEEIWETVDVKKTERAPVVDPMTGQVSMKEKTSTTREKKKKTVFDGIKLKSIPIEAIYKSPFIETIEEAVRQDAVFKVFEIPFSELQDRSKSHDGKPGFYIKEAASIVRPYIVDKVYKNLSELEQARAKNDGFFLDMMSSEEMVELAQGYCWYDIDGDGRKEEITATFYPKTGDVLRVSLTKCRIVELNPRPVDGRGYGEGMPKISAQISDEWENFHNTRSNAGQWENTSFGFYRAGGRINPQTLIVQPGRFYPVDDPREISFAQPNRVGSSYFQEEQMMLNYFERIFALDENMQGVGSSRRRSATESLKVASRASVRFGNPFNRIVTSVNKLLNHIWELNRECAPEEKEFYVIGPGGPPLFDRMVKYEYSANMRFGVAVSSVFDQQMIRDSILLAYRLFMANPFVQQHPELLWDLSQKTLDTLGLDISIPKPPQANIMSPYEKLNLIQRGEEAPEPEPGEDYDHALKVYMAQLNAESISEWDPKSVQALMLLIDKTKILKQMIEGFNLNRSGQFVPPQGMQGDKKQPNVTASRNPTQTFNNMRVNESPGSQRSNASGANIQGPSSNQGSVDAIMGNQI